MHLVDPTAHMSYLMWHLTAMKVLSCRFKYVAPMLPFPKYLSASVAFVIVSVLLNEFLTTDALCV
jgi:hypothetical protein